MTTPVFTNNLETTLAITTTASATTIEVADASVFNTLIQDGAGATNGVHEMATLTDGINIEVVKVTNAATGTNIITVTREQEGTTGYAFLVGDAIEGRLTAQELTNGFFGRAANSYSVVFGINSIDLVTLRSNAAHAATGIYSCAIGAQASATGDRSISMGLSATAAGAYGIALGTSASAGADTSLAVGNDADALGIDSTCVGRLASSSAAATKASSFGYSSQGYADRGTSLGYLAIVDTGAVSATAIGDHAFNRITKTHNISGPSLIRKDNAESDELLYFSGQENIIFSQEYDFTLALADNVIIILIPTGSTFFVSEVGFLPTSLNTITSNPTIEFGVNTVTDALMTATLTTTQTVKKRERYNEVLNATNWVTDAELVGATTQFTVSVTTAAVATTFLARVYFKGMLVEDE